MTRGETRYGGFPKVEEGKEKFQKTDFESDRGILKRRVLPLIEYKNRKANKDYYKDIYVVWDKMDKKKRSVN